VVRASGLGSAVLVGLALADRSGWAGVLSILTVWVFLWIWLSGYIRPQVLGSFGLLLGLVCISFFSVRRGLRFYILFELSLLPTLGMVLLYGYQPEKLRAGGHLLLYTALSSLPLLLLLINLPPYFSFWGNAEAVGGGAAIALTLAFIVKRPMYGVHLWLPKAHVEAPVAGRMALAGILLKLGSFGLYLVLPHAAGAVFVVYLLLSL